MKPITVSLLRMLAHRPDVPGDVVARMVLESEGERVGEESSETAIVRPQPIPTPHRRRGDLSQSADAIRMRARRAAAKKSPTDEVNGPNEHGEQANEQPNAFGERSDVRSGLARSPSDLVSVENSENDSEKPEGDSLSGSARGRTNERTNANEQPNAFGERSFVRSVTEGSLPPLIDPKLKLTPEARATGAMAGVRDVETAWIGFVGHCVSKRIRSYDFVAGEWPKWAGRARQYEERDRARESAKGGYGRIADTRPTEAERGAAERARREAARREPPTPGTAPIAPAVANLVAAIGNGGTPR